ncbi:MAG: YbbR-like domain-containing protein [Pedobacter sp.]|uniref:YbbR-like domain-containing protein n=1 Tax=Pedobacter sp. TaxID=1411316 RepID=UPI002807B6AB|nr:CdaR family protein [Pedobacter sp.]MDQ8005158.1 YbbR-like domain-containing protein [Pedobacter sp.]
MPFIKLTRLEQKRFGAVLICILCAVGAWLFMALNKKYPYTVQTEILYKDEPQGKAFKALQPDTVDLKVEGTGWQLLFARLRIKPPSVNVSLQKLNTRSYVVFSEQLDQINRQLETSQQVISVKPDTLFFDFSRRTNKRVPIKLISKLEFVPQYGIAKEIKLTPSYVNISGPQDELEKIHIWHTDSLKLNNIKESVETRVNVLKNAISNVSIYPNNVGVKLTVDEFTEKTIEVPLTILNNKEYYDVKLYPKKVKITLLVALSNYAKVDNTLKAVVDLNEWKMLRHNRLSVKVSTLPEFSKLVSISPSNVDFIIEK